MGVMYMFGCSLIAFGPALALFLITIMQCPVRIILFVVGAFFWLCSLLASALVWLMVIPLKSQLAFALTFSVIFQEGGRFLLYKLMNRMQEGMNGTLSADELKSISKHRLPFVVGFGFGAMECLFLYVNVLANLSGPGIIGIHGHSQNYFLISAILCNALAFTSIFWTVCSFKLWHKSKWLLYTVVPLSHFLIAYISLLDGGAVSGSVAKLITAYVIMLLSMLCAFKTTGGSLNSLSEFAKVCCSRS